MLNVDLTTCRVPDLTRRIMGRLGYMRVAPRVARRRRITMWAGRCVCAALAIVAVGLGVAAFKASPDARRPADITMPAAISHDLIRQQHRFGSILRLIQQPPAPLDVEEFDRLHRDSSADHADDPVDSHEIDEELNRSAVAPVRWV